MASAAPSVAEDPALGLDRRAKLEIVGAVLLALFLGALDQTIVGTALPRIVTDLQGNDLYTWVVTIYLLTSTITVPFYGKLSDLYGRRPLLMTGIVLFLAGSALSGLSQSMWQLILFRGIQGLGAGALFPIALAVVGDLFSPAERGRYQGLFGAVFGLSFLVGPGLGGYLTDAISWHWIFYVNIPIGIVSLYVIWRLLPTVRRPDATRNLDYRGAAIFAVAIGFLLVGLTNKQFGDWGDPAVGGFIAVGLTLSGLFLLVESRAPEPIVPLDLWRNRTYAASVVATFLVSMGFFSAVIFMPRWFQFVRGASAMESGYQLLALLVGVIGSSIVAGQLVSRTGRYKAVLLASIATMGAGLLLMTGLRADTPVPSLWLWMFVTGVGIGPTLAVFTIVVQNAVPFDKLGVATSNLTFFRQIGGTVGLAIAGTIFGTALQDELPRRLVAHGVPAPAVGQFADASPGALDQLVGVGSDLGAQILAAVPAAVRPLVEPLVPAIVDAIREAFSLAVGQTFIFAAAVTVLAFVATLAMRELALRRTTAPGSPGAPGAPSRNLGHEPQPVAGPPVLAGKPAAD